MAAALRARRSLLAVLLLAVLATYLAFAIVPGPRRVDSGLGWPIAIAVVAASLSLATLGPRWIRYAVGMSAITLGLAMAASGPHPELLGGLTLATALALGGVTLGASVWGWKRAIASYLAVGAWALMLLILREGPGYLPDHPNDVDAVFWTVIFPMTLWPEVTFGMLGAFGNVYH